MVDTGTFLHDAFISYRRQDAARIARALRDSLQQFELPDSIREYLIARDGHANRPRIAWDRSVAIGTNDFYEKTIRPQLVGSRTLIVIATPSVLQPLSDGSPNWVAREVSDFLSTPQAERVLVASPTSLTDPPVPALLRERFPRLHVTDAREIGDRTWLFSDRRLRVRERVAEIVGALYDLPAQRMTELREEERVRHRRRLRRVAASSMFATLVLAALSSWAWYQTGVARAAESDRALAADRAERNARMALRDEANGLAALAREARSRGEWPQARALVHRARERYASPLVEAEAAVQPFDPAHIVSVFSAGPSLERLVALTPSGDAVAYEEGERGVVVRESDTGAVRRRFDLASGRPTSIAISPDGTRIAIAVRGGGGTPTSTPPHRVLVEVFDANDGTRLHQLGSLNVFTDASHVVFSPDGQRIVAATPIHVFVWDARSGADLAKRRLDSPAASVCFSPDGATIAATSPGASPSLALYDAADFRLLKKVRLLGEGVAARPLTRASPNGVSYSPDGAEIHAVAGEAGVLRLRASDLERLPSLAPSTAAMTCVCTLKRAECVVEGGWDRSLHVVQARDGREIVRLSDLGDGAWWVVSSADGSRIAARTAAGSILVWDVDPAAANARAARSGKSPPKRSLEGSRDPALDRYEVRHDGSALIVVDRAGGSAETRVDTGARSGTALTISRDGHWLAVAIPDGKKIDDFDSTEVRLWSLAEPAKPPRVTWRAPTVGSLAFTRDGRHLIAASVVGTAAAIDLETSNVWDLIPVKQSLGAPATASCSPTRDWVVVCDMTGTLRAWDAGMTPPRELSSMTRIERGTITASAWHPGGDLLLVVPADRTQWVFEISTGRVLASSTIPLPAGAHVRFDANGTFAAAARDRSPRNSVPDDVSGDSTTFGPAHLEYDASAGSFKLHAAPWTAASLARASDASRAIDSDGWRCLADAEAARSGSTYDRAIAGIRARAWIAHHPTSGLAARLSDVVDELRSRDARAP